MCDPSNPETSLHPEAVMAAPSTRSPIQSSLMPRHFRAGPVLLDLFHRDGKVGGNWLGLHPREFALLWRLAESPRQRLSRDRLLADVWRLHHDPETNRVEVHVARVRAKLHIFGLSWLIATGPDGGYRLDADAAPVLGVDETPVQTPLDSYLHIGNDGDSKMAIGESNAVSPK